METINAIELADPAVFPDDAVLQQVLGCSFSAYQALLRLYEQYRMILHWQYYKDGKAWLCKVQYKKRTIIWMSAWKNFMQVTVYFTEKYTAGIYDLPITGEAKEKIRATRNVGSSKPCIFNITSAEVLQDLEPVIRYKLDSK